MNDDAPRHPGEDPAALSLWRALELHDFAARTGRAPVVAVVGGGGKTSLVYRLAEEAAQLGLGAIVAGTTRFTRAQPPLRMPPLIVAPPRDLPERVREAWRSDPDGMRSLVVAGDEPQPAGRLAPLDGATVSALASLPGLGLVALEADGSKLRPFKAPAEHEPVIPHAATHVVAVVGLDALDAPLDERHVHRPERVRAILGDPTVAHCSAEAIATVLVGSDGGRKGVEERPFAVVVNKVDLDPAAGDRLARAILDAGAPRVVLASLRDGQRPVRATMDAQRAGS